MAKSLNKAAHKHGRTLNAVQILGSEEAVQVFTRESLLCKYQYWMKCHISRRQLLNP